MNGQCSIVEKNEVINEYTKIITNLITKIKSKLPKTTIKYDYNNVYNDWFRYEFKLLFSPKGTDILLLIPKTELDDAHNDNYICLVEKIVEKIKNIAY